MFRADRINDASLLDEPARPPDNLEVPELVDGIFRPAADHLLVVLKLAPSYAWVADYYLPDETTELPDGLQISLRVADPGWVRSLVLGSAGEVTVLSPQWLAEEVRAEAAEALASYSGA